MSFFRKLNSPTILSLILAVLSLLLAFLYFFTFDDTLAGIIFLALSTFYLLPYYLSKKDRNTLSSLLLSFSTPFFILVVTLLYKTYTLADPVNYFDSRIMLITSAIIPLTTISFEKTRLLIVALIPSLLCLVLYDPLHYALGLDFFDEGLRSSDYYFSANIYSLLSYTVIVISLMRYKESHQQMLKEVNQKNYSLNQYLDTLLYVSQLGSISQGKVSLAYKEITRAAKQCLKVSRVSIWQYSKEEDTLSCQHIHDPDKPNQKLPILRASEYPAYFKAIKQGGLIIAPNARSHELTAEFTESYLQPYGICSMMDAMFHIDGSLAGIICCEQVGKVKDWRIEDSIFLRAISDFVCLVHNIHGRKVREEELQQSNRAITSLNNLLEERVKDRTKELKRKNEQLAEYAFINSHMLRGPIARVAGLANILQDATMKDLSDEYLVHLQNSILELEQITKKINTAIDTFGEVSRDKLEQALSNEQKKGDS